MQMVLGRQAGQLLNLVTPSDCTSSDSYLNLKLQNWTFLNYAGLGVNTQKQEICLKS